MDFKSFYNNLFKNSFKNLFFENIKDIFGNRSYIEILYVFLGISIFIHYTLVIFFAITILINIFITKEYKKIIKNKSIILVEIILGISVIMSIINKNFYGLVAIPILACLIVGRYYTLIVNKEFKNKNLELLGILSSITFFTSFIESAVKMGRAGYIFFHNPNYLGSVMMLASIINLYFYFEKKSKKNFVIFILNILTLIMSGSRSALIATLIGIFYLLYYFIEKKYFYIGIIFLSGYVSGVVFGVFPFLRMASLIRYFWLRIDIIKMAFIIFQRGKSTLGPYFGHGNFYYYKFTNYVYPHSHNAIVESLLSYGIVGTIILAIVFLKYIYEITKNNTKNILKIALILGIIGHNTTDFTIFWIQTVLLFIIALSYNEENNTIKRKSKNIQYMEVVKNEL